MRQPDTDSRPWYRHFYPWLVIALLASAVSGSLYTVYLAMSTSEPVLQDYQDQQ